MTDEQVVEIRKLYAGGMLQKNIARRFECSVPYIRQIIYGVAYPHVPLPNHRRNCIDCGAGIRQAMRCQECKAKHHREYNRVYARQLTKWKREERAKK